MPVLSLLMLLVEFHPLFTARIFPRFHIINRFYSALFHQEDQPDSARSGSDALVAETDVLLYNVSVNLGEILLCIDAYVLLVQSRPVANV
jgi:hypothetical protein